jgi:alkylhydroperoxidase family enzyme
MPWVHWIEITDDKTAGVKKSDLSRITSLTPQTSELIDHLCASVYKNATGLSAREKEIAALITSSLNGCVH